MRSRSPGLLSSLLDFAEDSFPEVSSRRLGSRSQAARSKSPGLLSQLPSEAEGRIDAPQFGTPSASPRGAITCTTPRLPMEPVVQRFEPVARELEPVARGQLA